MEAPELLQQHLNHLTASAISIDVIKERGYKSILGKKTLRDLAFSAVQCRTPGILMPIWSPDGQNTNYQYRPDFPRKDKKGKNVKYETPAGSTICLDVPPRCRSEITNPQAPLFVTEGIKKGDSLASHGACAVSLMGVWGFVGRNLQGGITTLSEWYEIALNGRQVYICYDSDIMTKRSVQQALDILAGFLQRRGAEVFVIYLPSRDGKKVGIDDFLVNHSLDEVIKLAKPYEELPKLTAGYRVEDGCICKVTIEKGGTEKVTPLCNFAAEVTEDVTKDDGIEVQHYFTVKGQLANSYDLPPILVEASSFANLNWVVKNWGVHAVIGAGLTVRDTLREAIQLMSNDATKRVVYTHTGWRQINGKWCFLTGGTEGLDVELPRGLDSYRLPEICDDPKEATAASLGILDVAPLSVTISLLAMVYSAPLVEVGPFNLTLFLHGTSGSLKTTLACLAISHFGGPFTRVNVPATFESTDNYLERLLSQAKDVLLLIDDYYPQPTELKARQQEQIAQRVIRAEAAHSGRGRLRSDTSIRPQYPARGLLVCTGEMLPTGQSTQARMLAIDIARDDVNLRNLNQAQSEASLYPYAMRSYVDWLAPQIDNLKDRLPGEFSKLRDMFQQQNMHLNIPETLAQLLIGWDMMLEHALSVSAITKEKQDELLRTGFETLVKLGQQQEERILAERPTGKFLDILSNLFAQKRIYVRSKQTGEEPENYEQWGWDRKETDDGDKPMLGPAAEFIGWLDEEENLVFLLSEASHKAVTRFAREQGEPLTLTKKSLHMQLAQEGILIPSDGKRIFDKKIGGKTNKVIQLKANVFTK
jgi:hypothetical protein